VTDRPRPIKLHERNQCDYETRFSDLGETNSYMVINVLYAVLVWSRVWGKISDAMAFYAI